MSAPPGPAPRLAQAMRLHQSGDVPGALALYEALLQESPDDATLHNFAGMAQIQLQQFADGEAHVQRALELDPAYADAWNSLGNLCRLAGRPEQALQAYQEMTRLAPAAVTGWINLADLYRQIGHDERARAALATAVARAEAEADAAPAFRHRLLQGLAALHGAWGLWDGCARLHAQALELAPGDAYARRSMIDALRQARRPEDALREAQAWVAREPANEDARRVLASIDENQTPARAADDEVSQLFDSHAGSFDRRLADLGYRAPALLQAAVAARLGAAGARPGVVCDAGCGTGLCGSWLRGHATALEGVDLSQGMLDLAHERGLYDRLERAEITAWLAAHPNRYALLVAADVLCYFGDLAPFAHAARAALAPGGLLAFTVEHDAEPGRLGYQLQLNGRYRHGEEAVKRWLEDAGFANIVIEPAHLRLEAGAPVRGMVITAV